MAVSKEEDGVEQRTPLWSVKAGDRALFNGCSIFLFIGVVLVEWPVCWQDLTKTAKDMIPLAAFSMIGAYFIAEVKDMLGGITDWVREKNRKIRQERQDMQEKNQMFEKWVNAEIQKGTQFNTPPPIGNNGGHS